LDAFVKEGNGAAGIFVARVTIDLDSGDIKQLIRGPRGEIVDVGVDLESAA
jgi:hypothetical protein